MIATPLPIAEEEPIALDVEYAQEEQRGLTDEEIELVARIVMSEARGECYEGKKAVAQVIYNRASLWDMSIQDVCLAKGQFAKPYGGEVTDDALNATIEAYYDCDSLGNATHFASNGVSWGKELVCEIGCHKFYK